MYGVDVLMSLTESGVGPRTGGLHATFATDSRRFMFECAAGC